MSIFLKRTANRPSMIVGIPADVIADMEIVLEFVERWNKNDEEKLAADAAVRVQNFLKMYKDIEAENDAKENLLDNLTNADELKLKNAHADDYLGTDDDMPDAYELWLEGLTSDELKQLLV